MIIGDVHPNNVQLLDGQTLEEETDQTGRAFIRQSMRTHHDKPFRLPSGSRTNLVVAQ